MKALTFNFSHPFRGRVCLMLATANQAEVIKPKFNEANDDIEIPLENCADGLWKIILDWEFEGRSFSCQKHFLVDANEVFIA